MQELLHKHLKLILWYITLRLESLQKKLDVVKPGSTVAVDDQVKNL